MMRPLRVVARLVSPLAGHAPQLDSLLESTMMIHLPAIERARGLPMVRNITRAGPAPPQGEVPIPIERAWLGDWLVARCSSPILGPVRSDKHDHFTTRFPVQDAALLRPDERIVINTTGGEYKSYRLPNRVRQIDAVAWFCVGDRHDLRKLLKRVDAIGKDVAMGYGAVAEWTVDDANEDWSWFADRVLMRPLPKGDWLPGGLRGARPDYAATVPPYWHAERFTECVVPC